jgi:transposase
MRDRFDHILERKLDTKPDSNVVVGPSLGVVTGPGRRREWPAAEKARIIVESLTPGANVSEVARRNGLSPQQLFGWRREARELFAQDRGETRAANVTVQPMPSKGPGVATSRTASSAPTFAPPTFVPVVVTTSGSAPQPNEADATTRIASKSGAIGTIELMIGSCVVRVVGRVDADVLKTVIELVRRFACS